MQMKPFLKEFVIKNCPTDFVDLNVLINFFESLKLGIEKEDLLSLLIGHWIYENITASEVRTRKVTAREFEDFLAETFDGLVLDTSSRKNLSVKLVTKIKDPYVKNYVVSNRREKSDVLFSDYSLTIKTTVPDNSEINMGSFAREALFKDLLTPSEYGSERKGGLGSRPQLLSKLNLIKQRGLWGEFVKRFTLMVTNIFSDDLLYLVKNDQFADIYIMKGDLFVTIVLEAAKSGPDELMKTLNRYEGNSLRINNRIIINNATRIDLDFSKIQDSNFYKCKNTVLEIDGLLYAILVGLDKNSEVNRKKIVNAINELLQRI